MSSSALVKVRITLNPHCSRLINGSDAAPPFSRAFIPLVSNMIVGITTFPTSYHSCQAAPFYERAMKNAACL